MEQDLQTQGSVRGTMPRGTQDSSGQVSQLCPGHNIPNCRLNWAVIAWHLRVFQSEAWPNFSLLMCLTERGPLIRKMNISYMQWNPGLNRPANTPAGTAGDGCRSQNLLWRALSLYRHQKAQQDSYHQRSTFVPKGASSSSTETLNRGMGELSGTEWEKDTGKRKNCTFGGVSGTGA